MKSVGKAPNWKGRFPPALSVGGPPSSLHGLAIKWKTWREPELIFVDQFSLLQPDSPDVRDAYLFGMRIELLGAELDGALMGEGYVVEFLVLEMSANRESCAHRLRQQSSVTFSDLDEPKDYLPAASIGNAAKFSTGEKPKWKGLVAVWPTIGGQPMIFVGQVTLRENAITRSLLTWDAVVYLFWLPTSVGSRFKIVTQKPSEQTADEHYALEERGRKKI